MEDFFKLEIISPEKIIFSDTIKMVTLPSYEGDMSILKYHVPIIAFLRPGIIKVQKNENSSENFFVQDGTIEYFNDNLVILSTSAINIKNLSKELIEDLSKNAQEKLKIKDIPDNERYILNCQLDVLKEIRI
tara:strand:- start:3528 stop:3923 length:396 start_codon:yes stop_codon:yes gene_type:complete